MRPLIAGNWKMHGLGAQLDQIAAIAAAAEVTRSSVDVLICPPDTLIERAAKVATRRMAIGGQNCRSELSGAFTGDVSAEMLKDAGASAVIVGHSERREHYGETDAVVAVKALAAWRAGLIAIICIGETETQLANGDALAVCSKQIAGSVPEGITSSVDVIAYEPRWAIGSGRMPSTVHISRVHAHIRQCLIARFGATQGSEIRIVYGGSVNPDNATEILGIPEVDGVLVGGESLKATDFAVIINAGAEASCRRNRSRAISPISFIDRY
jgi:triosephosphate isomerase